FWTIALNRSLRHDSPCRSGSELTECSPPLWPSFQTPLCSYNSVLSPTEALMFAASLRARTLLRTLFIACLAITGALVSAAAFSQRQKALPLHGSSQYATFGVARSLWAS